MRAARGRFRHRGMACCAFHENSYVALDLHALDVVIAMGGGEFGMGGAVACFTLQSTVPLGKAIERFSGRRRIGVRREKGAGGDAKAACGIEGTCVANLAVVLRGTARMTSLAAGFVQPSGAIQCSHCRGAIKTGKVCAIKTVKILECAGKRLAGRRGCAAWRGCDGG